MRRALPSVLGELRAERRRRLTPLVRAAFGIFRKSVRPIRPTPNEAKATSDAGRLQGTV